MYHTDKNGKKWKYAGESGLSVSYFYKDGEWVECIHDAIKHVIHYNGKDYPMGAKLTVIDGVNYFLYVAMEGINYPLK